MGTELMKNDIQEKLKATVREKFQELIDDKILNKFVHDTVIEFEKDMKRLVKDILKTELEEYVKNYLKTKMSVEYEGNRTRYDMAIVNAIREGVPAMFESMLGSMVNNAISNWMSQNRY
jgi:hypothetical protein